MDVKNYNRNRKKPVRKKGLRIVAFLLLFIGVVLAVFRYYKFMSKSIYEESVSHLTEVLHQSDQMLRELTNKNLTYLHIWGENLQNISGEDEIRDYIKKAQEDAGFLEFFFLSSDGDYKMATGETGYLGLQENIEEDIRQGNDVIANAAVPGKSQLLVFATPKAHGIYQGFEYDAIAIAYENSDIVNVLNISAFNGNAQSYVVHPDGRVVVDHSSEAWGEVYNFFGILREHSNMSEKEIIDTSNLFSEHYGVWSSYCPDSSKCNERVKFPPSMIKKNFVNKPDRFVAMVYFESNLIGHAFYIKRKGEKTKNIIWILQLVVAKQFRGNGIGSKLLHSIWGLSDCYAWGLFTSNPMTIKALERATMRKVDPNTINKKLDKLKSVAYDIFDDSSWIDNYSCGMVNTEFYVDHKGLNKRIKKTYKRGTFLLNRELPEGYEWLAFTFNSQPPRIDDTQQLDAYLEYSNDIIQQAYSMMNMQNHKWTSRTKEEIDYLCEKYIKKNDSVIDVGCGIGRHTIELNKRGIKTKGIDFSKENIKSAQKAYNPECFISGDVRSYKFKEKYDVAIALYDVIGSFPNDKENLNLLKSIRKILNNKGILIISVMNMTYTKRKCWNVLEDIDDNIDALLKLQGTNTMQKTGDVFSGDSMLIDDKSGIVYRKEQFFSKNSLPCEYIIRDRRYTIKGIDNLLQKAGFRVIDSYCFSAKNMSQEVDEISGKEIFVVAQKQNSLSLLSRNTFLMPQTWKK